MAQSNQANLVEPKPRWHVIAVQSRRETWALQNLLQRRHEAYLPMRKASTWSGTQGGRRVRLSNEHIYATPLFPGYLFVRIQSAREWASIFTTMGVKSVIGTRERPAAFREGVVEALQASEINGMVEMMTREEISERLAKLEAGDPVAVAMGGHLGELNAIFDSEVDDDRIAVLLSFCGSDSRRTIVPKSRVSSLK